MVRTMIHTLGTSHKITIEQLVEYLEYHIRRIQLETANNTWNYMIQSLGVLTETETGLRTKDQLEYWPKNPIELIYIITKHSKDSSVSNLIYHAGIGKSEDNPLLRQRLAEAYDILLNAVHRKRILLQ
jgi:hypothetical protein